MSLLGVSCGFCGPGAHGPARPPCDHACLRGCSDVLASRLRGRAAQLQREGSARARRRSPPLPAHDAGSEGGLLQAPHEQAPAAGLRARDEEEARGDATRGRRMRQSVRSERRHHAGSHASFMLALALLRSLHGDERGNDERSAPPAPGRRQAARGDALRRLPRSADERVDEHPVRPAGATRPTVVRRGLVRAAQARRDPADALGANAAQAQSLPARRRDQLERASRLHGRCDPRGRLRGRLLQVPGRLRRRAEQHRRRALARVPGLLRFGHPRRRHGDPIRRDLLRRHARRRTTTRPMSSSTRRATTSAFPISTTCPTRSSGACSASPEAGT